MNRPIWILIDGTEKQNFISNSNVSRVRIYVKLRLKAWHKAINTILEYYRVAHLSKKSGVELHLHCLKRAMRGHSFWLAVRLNTGLGVGFLYPHPPWLRSGAIGPAFLLYSGVWTIIKEDPKKGIGRSKAGSADRRLDAVATLFVTLTLYPE